MRKIREVCYCDRCHKEIKQNEIQVETYDHYWKYELCPECDKLFEEFYDKVKDYEQLIEDAEKEYWFGRFTPREEDNE